MSQPGSFALAAVVLLAAVFVVLFVAGLVLDVLEVVL